MSDTGDGKYSMKCGSCDWSIKLPERNDDVAGYDQALEHLRDHVKTHETQEDNADEYDGVLLFHRNTMDDTYCLTADDGTVYPIPRGLGQKIAQNAAVTMFESS